MSGIFGVVSKECIDNKDYLGLELWNKGYGDGDVQSYTSDKYLYGICHESVKKSVLKERFILEKNQCRAVIDALIFSKYDNGCSDEQFIFDTIYEKGISSLVDVNGDFSGAFWSEKKGELVLFRDHCGVRPLFYYIDDARVIFSSDIRGIISIRDVNADINEEWLYKTLEGYSDITPADTEYKNIKCVPFGGYISFWFTENDIKTTTGYYWKPGEKKIRFKNREQYTVELRKLVEDAVRIRAEVSELPVGAELSGGLDSGVISLILAEMDKRCFYFSWTPGVEDLTYADKDERYVINDICEKAGIDCYHGKLSVNFDRIDVIKKSFPLKTDSTSELPFFLEYVFPNYINTTPIYETAAFLKEKGVKLVFTGHGGDEGISHRGDPYELFYSHEYYRYLRLMYSRTSRDKHRIIKTISLIRKNLLEAEAEFKVPFVYMNSGGDKVVNEKFSMKYKRERMPVVSFSFDPKSYIVNGGSRNRLDVLSFFGACTGVRYMAPFMDYRVVDFALGIPRYLYFNWFWDRYIFREAFKDIMPKSLYKQRDKESYSYNSLPQAAPIKEDPEKIIASKVRYLSILDRNKWSKYLDYSFLDEWSRTGEKRDDDIAILNALMACIQAENVVKRSREVYESDYN